MSKTLRWVASTKGGGEGRERKEWRGSEGERKGEREKESLLKKIGNQIIEMAQSTLTDDSINKMCYIRKRNITQPLQVIKC